MSYKCYKCEKEVGQVVSYQGEDYCYHCADKFIEYPKKDTEVAKNVGEEDGI